jgi:hypothetical protein
MKKILLLLTGIYICFSLNAQSFSGGILAGFSASQYDGDGYSGFHRVGGIAGVYVGHSISKKFSWNMEIKYIQKGSYQNPNPDPLFFSRKYDLRLNYAEIPFLIKYDYKYKLSFEAGLGLGYLAGHYERLDDIDRYPNGDRPFHKFELSYQLGGYYQITKRLSVNLRYLYSLLPVRPHESGAKHGLNWGEYNNMISFSLKCMLSKLEDADE